MFNLSLDFPVKALRTFEVNKFIWFHPRFCRSVIGPWVLFLLIGSKSSKNFRNFPETNKTVTTLFPFYGGSALFFNPGTLLQLKCQSFRE